MSEVMAWVVFGVGAACYALSWRLLAKVREALEVTQAIHEQWYSEIDDSIDCRDGDRVSDKDNA